MAKNQSPPLTEEEIRYVFRNDYFTINDPRYFPKEIPTIKRVRKIYKQEEKADKT